MLINLYLMSLCIINQSKDNCSLHPRRSTHTTIQPRASPFPLCQQFPDILTSTQIVKRLWATDHCYLSQYRVEGGGFSGRGAPEKQSRSNLRWMRLISPNNNRREAVLLSRPTQTMAIHANPWPESRQYSLCESPCSSPSPFTFSPLHPPLPTSLQFYLRLHLRLLRISRWGPMMPDYRSLLEEEGKRLELGIRAAERQGEVSFARRCLNL